MIEITAVRLLEPTNACGHLRVVLGLSDFENHRYVEFSLRANELYRLLAPLAADPGQQPAACVLGFFDSVTIAVEEAGNFEERRLVLTQGNQVVRLSPSAAEAVIGATMVAQDIDLHPDPSLLARLRRAWRNRS